LSAAFHPEVLPVTLDRFGRGLRMTRRYGHIHDDVLPALREHGVTDAQI
jgi:hypothetical protein